MLPFGDALLIICRNGDAYTFAEGKLSAFPLEHPFSDRGIVRALLTSDNKLIILPSQPNGIYQYSATGKLEMIYGKTTGIRSEDCLGVFEDQRGALWVGTQEGISRIDVSGPYQRFDERLGLAGTTQSILSYQNQLYLGTDEGPVHFSAKEGRIRATCSVNEYVWHFTDWQDRLFIGTSGGAYEIGENGCERLPVPTGVSARIVGSRFTGNQLYIVVGDGLVLLEETAKGWMPITEIRSIRGSARDLVEIQPQEVWLKTRSNGLFRIQWEQGAMGVNYASPDITGYGPQQGLPVGEHNIFRIEEELLVRTEGDELYRYDRSTDRFVLSNFLAERYDITAERVLPRSPETAAGIWLDVFYNGQRRFVRAQRNLDGSAQISSYPYTAEMAKYHDPTSNEIFTADANQAWVAGMLGVLRVNLSRLAEGSPPPSIRLSHVSSGTGEVFAPDSTITFSYAQNDLVFHYRSPTFQQAEHLRFATQLAGYDADWSAWSTAPQKAYTNLPRGSYTFRVKARDDLGQSSEVATYSFRVRPPWYRSIGAYLVAALLFAVGLLLFLRYRAQRARWERERLEQLVAERTAEIAEQAQEINYLYAVKSRFLANISHELRTPLTLILGPAEQLLNTSSPGPERQQLTWIYRNGQKLRRLIN
ncbi:MAG: histidine kinase dimerization/phospho-acceptor domain-containing protein, partial [Bacteroidota bacterium]